SGYWLTSLSLLRTLPSPPQYLCGTHLMDALYLVCGEKGPKRDSDLLPEFLSLKSVQENEVEEYQMDMMVKRGILDQCCHNPCNIFHHE
uniref:Insulin-like domain-containing protein n=1 Tax=Oncorhynchus mykiss TaxID=8022 RepID=A0A8K9UYK7_ONCMY